MVNPLPCEGRHYGFDSRASPHVPMAEQLCSRLQSDLVPCNSVSGLKWRRRITVSSLPFQGSHRGSTPRVVTLDR